MTYRIYKLLRGGRISGDQAGLELFISRAAVNKHINKLKDAGAVINSSSGVGYEWIKDSSIHEYALRYHLENLNISSDVIVKPVDSTNSEAKRLLYTINRDTLIAAPYQTGGRGRLDRKFSSAEGGAYFSLVINDSGLPAATAMRIVLIAGLAVVDTLINYNVKAELKWPNDVYVNGKKNTGILSELTISGETADKIIVGIGINIYNNLPPELIDKATRLIDYTEKSIEIAEIIAHTAKKLYEYIEHLKKDEWEEIKAKYIKYSYTIGKTVEYNGKKGIAKGITEEGFLIVECEDREIIINAGDVNIC
jgi:BirA family biotin operon repressor/biotin-[acetyl-CoA-carboxylase] ligase